MSVEVNVIPTLRKFRGGPVEAFLGGAELKKNTLYDDRKFGDNLALVS